MRGFEQLPLPSVEEQLDDIATRQYQESLDRLDLAETATRGFQNDPTIIAELGLQQAIYARRAQEVQPYLAERGLVEIF